MPSVHPYILMNFHGRTRDVMTLAHELGHGVHQVLAGEQGYLISGTPLTLAETASVFGEMLTFRALLDAETDPARRRLMLAGKVEDMLNTVVRQIAFYRFETLLHDERRLGELLPERIGEIWMQVQTESLGPGIRVHAGLQPCSGRMCRISCTRRSTCTPMRSAIAWSMRYTARVPVRPPGFPGEIPGEMLRAGGTKVHRDLLAPFGLDASDPAFWRRGLDVIAGFIDELEAASREVGKRPAQAHV